MNESALRTAAARVAACLAAVILNIVPVVAQGTSPAATTGSQVLQVRGQADGRLFVSATNAPFDELLRAVVVAAAVRLTVVGPIPHDPVTVLFPDAFADEILAAMMNDAGVSYVLAGGHGSPGGRLVVGALRSDGSSPPQQASSVQAGPPQKHPFTEKTGTQIAAPVAAEAARERPADPTEWPAGIEPVNAGAPPNVPDSREALFLQVNGSLPTTSPVEMTPNLRTLRPEDVEPVNPARTHVTPPGVPTPGMATAPSAPPTPPAGTTPPAPEMLTAPKPIAIPGPVVVTFPPPKQP